MTRGAKGSKIPQLPIVHLAHLVETGAWFVVGGAVAGAALALLIRRRRWSWTFGLPLLVAVPDVTLLSWRAQIGSDACAAAAIGVGAGATWSTCVPEATWPSEPATALVRSRPSGAGSSGASSAGAGG